MENIVVFSEKHVVDAVYDILIECKATARAKGCSWPNGDTGTRFTIGSHDVSVRRSLNSKVLRLEVRQIIGSGRFTLLDFPLGPGMYKQQLRVVLGGLVALENMLYEPVNGEAK